MTKDELLTRIASNPGVTKMASKDMKFPILAKGLGIASVALALWNRLWAFVIAVGSGLAAAPHPPAVIAHFWVMLAWAVILPCTQIGYWEMGPRKRSSEMLLFIQAM